MDIAKLPTLRDRTFARLRASIHNEPTDGFGIFHYYTFPFYHNVTGVNLNEYFHRPEVMFETQLEVLERLEKCGSFQPDAGPCAEASSLGGQIRFDQEGFISTGVSGIDPEDPMNLEPGDPWGDNYMRVSLTNLQYMVEHAPKDIRVNPPCLHGPFTVAAQLRGINDFCLDTLEEPEFVEALMDVCCETSIRFEKEAEKILGEPLHHILLCDDLSSFVNADTYEELVMPFYKRIFDAFPQTEFWLHNDANAKHLAGKIADAGFKAWQHAPSIASEDAMAGTRGEVSLLGGLAPLKFQHISPQETYEICIEKMKSYGNNTKYTLSFGGSVNQVPVENLLAMFRAADEFKIND